MDFKIEYFCSKHAQAKRIKMQEAESVLIWQDILG